MALFINEDCIACDACVSECPNTAIYSPDEEWSLADGTSLSDDTMQEALSDEFTFIIADKCTECKGTSNDEPACVDVCPTDAIQVNEELAETEEALLSKYATLHA